MISGLPERSLAIPLRPRQFDRNPVPHHTNPFSLLTLWARRKRNSARGCGRLGTRPAKLSEVRVQQLGRLPGGRCAVCTPSLASNPAKPAQGLRMAEATQRCPGVAPGSWGLCSGPSIPAHRDDQRLDIVFGSLGHAERSIECLATGTRRVPAGAGSLTLRRERLAADGWAALLDSSSWPLVIRRPSWMPGFLCLRTVLPDWFVPPLQENVPSSAGCSACRRPFGRQNA